MYPGGLCDPTERILNIKSSPQQVSPVPAETQTPRGFVMMSYRAGRADSQFRNIIETKELGVFAGVFVSNRQTHLRAESIRLAHRCRCLCSENGLVLRGRF